MAATAESVLKPDFQTARKHFIFTDEHEQLRESITKFAIKELAPHAEEWEETTFPDSVFTRMGELGFLGLDKPEEYGGQGGDYFSALVLAEAIATPTRAAWRWGGGGTDMAMPPILAWARSRSGSGSNRRSRARRSCAWASPSPTPARTSGIKTRAVRDGETT